MVTLATVLAGMLKYKELYLNTDGGRKKRKLPTDQKYEKYFSASQGFGRISEISLVLPGSLLTRRAGIKHMRVR